MCKYEIIVAGTKYVVEVGDVSTSPVQVIVNKIDLCQQEPREDLSGTSYTSATGGVGIEPLISTLARRLVPGQLAPGDAVPINERQQGGLFDAQRALCHGDCLSALAALEGLLQGDASVI